MARMSADERRSQLIEAALAVMSDEGLHAATTRRISEYADVKLATVHYVFGNKQALLEAVMTKVTDDVAATVSSAIRRSTGLSAAIEDSITGFWSMVEQNVGLQIMQYEVTAYALRTPGLAWLAKWQYDSYCKAVEDAYRDAMRDDETADIPIPQLARLVVAGVDGIILQFVTHRSVRRARRDVRNLVGAVGRLVTEGNPP